MPVRIDTIVCAVAFLMGSVSLVPQARAGGAPLGQAPGEQGRINTDKTDKKDLDHEVSTPNSEIKPEVSALIKQSTSVYAAMKSYKHVSEYLIKGQGQEGEINRTLTYTLALERPNKFCYKSDEVSGSAAVSNGKTFINHRKETSGDEHERTYYTKTSAPATYKGINIVDDVTFTYGTYMIALMLQGDVSADSEVREALAHATVKPSITDNGKKYDLLIVPFQGHPVNFYFDATSHLLHKTVDNQQSGTGHADGLKVTEIIENVIIDKPLPASTFEYTPPKSSRLIVALPARTKGQIALARHLNSDPDFKTNSGRTLITIFGDF